MTMMMMMIVIIKLNLWCQPLFTGPEINFLELLLGSPPQSHATFFSNTTWGVTAPLKDVLRNKPQFLSFFFFFFGKDFFILCLSKIKNYKILLAADEQEEKS